MSNNFSLKIGLFGIGLEAYWQQFAGLKQRLEGYMELVAQKLQGYNAAVINLGLIDTPGKAMQAGHTARQEDVDILFLYVTTYALSSTVLPVVQRAKVPVIILNLSPEAAIDYETFNAMTDRTAMTGEWLAFCSACPVPELANVFNRAGIQFNQVTGVLNDETDECWAEIKEWVEAANVARVMSHNRLGVMGHYYSGMLDIYSDFTQQLINFGGHIEIIEIDELSAIKRQVDNSAAEQKLAAFNKHFEIQDDCLAEALAHAARTAVALDKIVHKYGLGSIAYYYKGTGIQENEDTLSTIILGASLLTANHVPVAGEFEIKNVQAMKIMDSFNAGGSFTEYYAMDFKDDVVLMGHDGPGHIAIAQGKTKVRPLKVYHGKVGKGLSIEMSVKNGPVTLLSVVQKKNGSLMLLCAEGLSAPGPILQIGNTNSRYKFSIGARRFVNNWNAQGPAHHCAVGTGHIAGKIEKLGKLLDMEVVKIC
ncbi:MAG TPA: hypothetical protein VHB48_05075 [Chitinophagaceae bacterium]|nr:hypothetical protein [Chitinophagaceae bacterium]